MQAKRWACREVARIVWSMFSFCSGYLAMSTEELCQTVIQYPKHRFAVWLQTPSHTPSGIWPTNTISLVTSVLTTGFHMLLLMTAEVRTQLFVLKSLYHWVPWDLIRIWKQMIIFFLRVSQTISGNNMVDSCCGGCLALGSYLENLSQNMTHARSSGSLDTVGCLSFYS